MSLSWPIVLTVAGAIFFGSIALNLAVRSILCFGFGVWC